MSAVELTIKGDVEVLRLQPGDKIVVKTARYLTNEALRELLDACREAFPDNQVVVLGDGIRLEVVA